jgi:hypothetical protein
MGGAFGGAYRGQTSAVVCQRRTMAPRALRNSSRPDAATGGSAERRRRSRRSSSLMVGYPVGRARPAGFRWHGRPRLDGADGHVQRVGDLRVRLLFDQRQRRDDAQAGREALEGERDRLAQGAVRRGGCGCVVVGRAQRTRPRAARSLSRAALVVMRRIHAPKQREASNPARPRCARQKASIATSSAAAESLTILCAQRRTSASRCRKRASNAAGSPCVKRPRTSFSGSFGMAVYMVLLAGEPEGSLAMDTKGEKRHRYPRA